MAKRFKMTSKGSRRHFTKNAVKTHWKNSIFPMRGGIRA